MSWIVVLLIVLLAAVADYYWLDQESKRWNWFKNLSIKSRIAITSGFLILSVVVYLVMGKNYF
ncbi:MAG: hypothetical protein ACI35O_12335 [Bacillaceae bacterium]